MSLQWRFDFMNPFKSETQEFTRARSELKDASRPLLLCLYIVYLFIFFTWKISHIFFVCVGRDTQKCICSGQRKIYRNLGYRDQT